MFSGIIANLALCLILYGCVVSFERAGVVSIRRVALFAPLASVVGLMRSAVRASASLEGGLGVHCRSHCICSCGFFSFLCVFRILHFVRSVPFFFSRALQSSGRQSMQRSPRRCLSLPLPHVAVCLGVENSCVQGRASTSLFFALFNFVLRDTGLIARLGCSFLGVWVPYTRISVVST